MKTSKKVYVRPVVVGCYGKDGCPLPESKAEKLETKERLAKEKKAKLIRE